tara:strand:- start:741 stop:1415 length:675 start_codon:yes stop_codon:yes gene_type:complete
MITIGESISRVRNVLKAVKEDPFLTDRLLYSLVIKFAKTLIKREDQQGSLFKHTGLFKDVPCLELIEIDKVEACCTGIKTACKIMRTKYELPKLLELSNGPIIRSVTSLDYSQELTETFPTLYTNMTKTSGFRYNKTNYYWYLNNHMYFPNLTWEAVRVTAIWDESLRDYVCSEDSTDCQLEQDRELSIPDHLFSEIEQMVIQQLLTAGQVPSDGADDSQNVLR